jgi:hypothetical protein
MSIATLKRKTNTMYNNMSVNQEHFSLNGGYRNQGFVGQTTLSRSLPKTRMNGPTLCGYGGCCDTYNIKPIVQSAVLSTNDNRVMKHSVINNKGMISTKYRWITRPAPYTSVKPDCNHNKNTESQYIFYIKRQTLNATSSTNNQLCGRHIDEPSVTKSCAVVPRMFQPRINTPQSFNNAQCYNSTTKNTAVDLTNSESNYIDQLTSQCTEIDKEFLALQMKSTQSTPFACTQ